MGRESKNYIADNLIELVDDLSAWDAYPWGEYFWRALYRRLVNVISRHKEAVKLKNKKDVSRTKKTKKIDSSKKIETYNVYGFVWSLKIYILEMYRNNKFWWKKDPLVIPRGLAWSKIGNFEKPWLIRSIDYFRTLLVDGQPNGPLIASPQGIQPIICPVVVHDPQFDQEPKELVAEYQSITTKMTTFQKIRWQNNVLKEIKSSDGKADSAISNVLIGEISCQNLVQEQLQSRDMCIQSNTNQFVQHPLESPKRKMPKSSYSDVFHSELSVVETSKNEALSKEFDPKEYDKNVVDSGDGKVIFIVHLISCDNYVGGFYTDPKDYPSSSMTQLLEAAVPEQTSSQMLAYTPVDLNLPNLNESFTESQVNEYAEYDFDNPENNSLSDMVKTGKEEIHLDGSKIVDDPFVQIPDKQYFEEMSMYVNEVNVVNKNQPPSSEKVVGQLMRKRKRLKRKARLLQIQNTRISFDDDFGDDDSDFKVLSLEEWESTTLKKKQNNKEPIRQSQIALKEIPLVEFHEDLSRAPYSRRTKVKLPECLDMVYALGDDTSHIFPWGNNDIFVYRSFWLNLLGLRDGGWLSDRHLDAWFELMWRFRPKDADWAIASSYFCGFVMRGDIPGWVCNGVTYPVMWADVEQVFFSINEPNKHYCLGVLHIRTGVITLYDSLFSEAVETRKWWIKMRKAFKKYIPPYLQEWGILDAKGIPLESYNITFVVGKDVPIQGDAYGDCGVWVCIFLYRLIHKMAVSAKDPQIVGLAYREHMFDYFWKYKIAN
ncbi:phospholipase-like protein [Tanacetum coccineum]